MDLKISKTQMELANKTLERRAVELNDVSRYRGIPAAAFDKEHLVMLCNLFANEWHKSEELCFAVLKGSNPTYKARAKAVCAAPYKPSTWRQIWNRIKS